MTTKEIGDIENDLGFVEGEIEDLTAELETLACRKSVLQDRLYAKRLLEAMK